MKRIQAMVLGVLGLLASVPAFANDTVYYYYNDAQGSPVAVTDANGTVIERTQYAPYGQVLNRPEHDGPGYTKHEEDAATGLTNMQQRYDDKVIGRMLSMDPMDVDTKTGSNFNRYAYADDNPYRYTDPDGRESGAGYATGEYTPEFQQDRETESSNFDSALVSGLETLDEMLSEAPPEFGGLEDHAIIVPALGALRKVAAVAKVADKAEEAAQIGGKGGVAGDAAKLSKQLASEQQVGELAAGKGVAVAGGNTGKELRQADRLADTHGGKPSDWTKVTSSSHTAPDGMKMQTHAYQNQATGQVVEHKTKMVDEGQ